MIIYIVRHGQTAENLQMILQGHLPGILTDKGKEQVRNAAEHLAEKDVQFKCIVSSDLKTCNGLCRYHLREIKTSSHSYGNS